MGRWMDGKMVGWIDGWMNESKFICFFLNYNHNNNNNKFELLRNSTGLMSYHIIRACIVVYR